MIQTYAIEDINWASYDLMILHPNCHERERERERGIKKKKIVFKNQETESIKKMMSFNFLYFLIGNKSFIEQKCIRFTMVNKLYLKQLQTNQREELTD